MMIRGTAIMLFIGGFMLWFITQFVPFFKVLGLDWVGQFMEGGAIFILLFVFGLSQTGLQYDTIPPGTAVINYIRRDGLIAPLLGKRIFSGESFLDVPRLGLIEDLGTDTVFLWGKKKVRFGLENINYTPDPRYWNMCKELYELGFDDMEDLYNVMNIPNMDNKTEKTKKVYYLERMGNIYWNMTHNHPRGVKHLMDIFKKKREKNVTFGPRRRKAYSDTETRTETKDAVSIKKEPQFDEETVKKLKALLEDKKDG